MTGYDLQSYLEEAPTAWELLVKKTFVKKEEILPLQMGEMEILRQDHMRMDSVFTKRCSKNRRHHGRA